MHAPDSEHVVVGTPVPGAARAHSERASARHAGAPPARRRQADDDCGADGDAALKALLVGPRAGKTPACAVVKASRLLPLGPGRLARAADSVGPGDVVAYAIAIEGPIVVRLLLLLTLGVRAARARRVLQRAGATRVCRYAVTPSLERPTIAYEIGTPAAQYADRHLRPRGGDDFLRRIIARVAGVDPSIGAVVIAGLKA
jgi:hypothetical protein